MSSIGSGLLDTPREENLIRVQGNWGTVPFPHSHLFFTYLCVCVCVLRILYACIRYVCIVCKHSMYCDCVEWTTYYMCASCFSYLLTMYHVFYMLCVTVLLEVAVYVMCMLWCVTHVSCKLFSSVCFYSMYVVWFICVELVYGICCTICM